MDVGACCNYRFGATKFKCKLTVLKTMNTLSLMADCLMHVEVIISPQPVTFPDDLKVHGFLSKLFQVFPCSCV